MLSLWARNINTKRYEFIKYVSYENRFFEMDELDKDTYYEAMIVNENQDCIMYLEFERPKVLKKGR